MKVPAPPLLSDFATLALFHEAMAAWRVGLDEIRARYKDDREADINMDMSHWPHKSMRQLLLENPVNAGGLTQLAQAEEQAERRHAQLQRFLIKVTRQPVR